MSRSRTRHRRKPSLLRRLLLSLAVFAALGTAGAGYWLYAPRLPTDWSPLDDTGGCELFPPSVVFRQRIDDLQRFPKHPNSDRWLLSIGRATRLHADWGESDNPARVNRYYGIPYNVVSLSELPQPWPLVRFDAADPRDQSVSAVDESDCAVTSAAETPRVHRGCHQIPEDQRRFPFPPPGVVKAEGGLCNDPNLCGDRHVLVIESSSCRLWESYRAFNVNNQWLAYSTAEWDLTSTHMRPQGWTSSDAAGLPILPLLARAREAWSGEVKHALRVTFRDSVLAKSFVWPATHAAGDTRADGIPFGALLRLRDDFVVPWWWTTQARALALAMKQHGLYVADIGSDFYVQGEPHRDWSPATRLQVQRLRLRDFEFVDTAPFESKFSQGRTSYGTP